MDAKARRAEVLAAKRKRLQELRKLTAERSKGGSRCVGARA